MKQKIRAAAASAVAAAFAAGMTFSVPNISSAAETGTVYVPAAVFDFDGDSSGTPAGFVSRTDSTDEYPEIDGRGKVYKVTSTNASVAAVKLVDGLALPDNYELKVDVNSLTPSAGKSAGIYVLSDDTGANEGNFLAVRPNHGTNQLDVLANNGGTLKIESYDAQATLSADTWYTIRACVENDSLSLYISDDTTEYTVAEDITAVGGIAISDIRKYAFTAGLRPYGTTCMYDNFTIGVPGLAGMYELSDPLEADASAEIIDDDGASGGSYVKVSGEENNTASFEIAPPGEGEYHVYIGYKTSPEYSKASFKLVRGGFPTIELGEVDMNSETEEFKEIQLADASFAGTDTMQLVMTLGGAAAAIDYIRVAEIPEDLFSANTGRYVIREDLPQQTIWGLGVEIQSDSIASGDSVK